MGRRAATVLLLAVGIPTAAPVAAAQDTLTVSGEVTCQECAIVLDTVVTIGGLDGPGLETIYRLSTVAVDRRNRIHIGRSRPPSVSVFDETGRFIRSYGRSGEGPGEYESISHVTAGPQYIHVFDRHRGRTMLDYDFNVVRVDPFPGQVHNSVVLESDAVVFSAFVGTRELAGYRFHVLDTLGAFTSFDERPGAGWFNVSAREDGVWTGAIDRNDVQRWQLEPVPTLRRVILRTVREFDMHTHLEEWPGVGNAAIRRDEDGLWVAWNAPDPKAPKREPGASIPWGPNHEFKDGWIDLVDPRTGLTVARYRGDAILSGFAYGSKYVVVYDETEDGVPYIHLLEPRLVRRQGRRRIRTLSGRTWKSVRQAQATAGWTTSRTTAW